MSAGVGFPHLGTTLEPNAPVDEPLRRQVWGILAAMYPHGTVVERRMDQRYPYPHFFYLTPVAGDGISPQGASTVVIGKSLSERGLSFYYQQPLAERRMIASLETSPLRWAGFLIDITWCRFTQYGWYEGGGRFVGTVPSPIGAACSTR